MYRNQILFISEQFLKTWEIVFLSKCWIISRIFTSQNLTTDNKEIIPEFVLFIHIQIPKIILKLILKCHILKISLFVLNVGR